MSRRIGVRASLQCPPEYKDAGAEAPENVDEVSDKQLRKLHANLMDRTHILDRCKTYVRPMHMPVSSPMLIARRPSRT